MVNTIQEFNNPPILRLKDFPHSYLILSNNAAQIQFQPWIVGKKLQELAIKCSMEFLLSYYKISPEIRAVANHEVCDLVPLTGSLYYNIAQAYSTIFDNTLATCFIGAKRELKPNHEWEVIMSYFNFEAMTTNTKIIIVGDTIATGVTIAGILRTIIKKNPNIKEIVVYSIAGALQGLKIIKELEKEVKIPIYCFFSNAVFALAENGTDMFWEHPDTITTNEMKKQALDHYGELAQTWCTIWDWGERCKDPIEHLETIEKLVKLEKGKKHDTQTLKNLEKILTEVNKEKQAQIQKLQVKNVDQTELFTNKGIS